MYLIKEIEFVFTDQGIVMLNLVNAAADIIDENIYENLIENKYDSLDNEIIKRMMDRCYLFENEQKYIEFIESIDERIELVEKESIPNFVLIPSYNCNLNCIYCFENTYEIISQNFRVDDTQINNQFTIINNIINEMKVKEKNKVNITIMGGEPLLKSNYLNVEQILKLSNQQGYSVDVVTNGVELDSFIDLFNNYRSTLKHIQITLDGTKKIHDTRRVFFDKSGTYDKILSNIHKALEALINVYVRVNVDYNNILDLPKLANELLNEFYRSELLHPYIYLLQDGGCSGEQAIINEQIGIEQILKLEESNPSMGIFNKKFHPDDFISSIIENKKFQPTHRHCAASKNQYILDCKGNIYKCWHGIGNDLYRIGTYTSAVEINDDELNKWYNRSVNQIDLCKNCKYRYICGTGCPAAKHIGNDKFEVNKPNCVDYKSLINIILSEKFKK